MVMSSTKVVIVEQFVKYDGNSLWIRVDSRVRELGLITTRLGGLTHEQKLKAVAGQGEWVKI